MECRVGNCLIQRQCRLFLPLVDIEELLAAAEVFSLHCPLLPQTWGIVNASSSSKMKPRSFLIITSRGPLVVEQDLAAAPASQDSFLPPSSAITCIPIAIAISATRRTCFDFLGATCRIRTGDLRIKNRIC